MGVCGVVIGLVPSGVVTVTSTIAEPPEKGGETAVIELEEVTVKLLALVEPNLTAVAPLKLVPVMVTVVPPDCGPWLGSTLETIGPDAADADPTIATIVNAATVAARTSAKPRRRPSPVRCLLRRSVAQAITRRLDITCLLRNQPTQDPVLLGRSYACGEHSAESAAAGVGRLESQSPGLAGPASAHVSARVATSQPRPVPISTLSRSQAPTAASSRRSGVERSFRH